jgi:hypothetical protein
MKHNLMRPGWILLGVGSLTGCEMTTSLSEDGPAGVYEAIILVSTTGTVTTNHLADGGAFRITLFNNGTTRGRLELVAHGVNPAADADLTGTWTRSGDQIDFTIAAGTFVNDMVFTIVQITDQVWWLEGDQVISGTRFNVNLAHDT